MCWILTKIKYYNNSKIKKIVFSSYNKINLQIYIILDDYLFFINFIFIY